MNHKLDAFSENGSSIDSSKVKRKKRIKRRHTDAHLEDVATFASTAKGLSLDVVPEEDQPHGAQNSTKGSSASRHSCFGNFTSVTHSLDTLLSGGMSPKTATLPRSPELQACASMSTISDSIHEKVANGSDFIVKGTAATNVDSKPTHSPSASAAHSPGACSVRVMSHDFRYFSVSSLHADLCPLVAACGGASRYP